jgi:hypothetical protein
MDNRQAGNEIASLFLMEAMPPISYTTSTRLYLFSYTPKINYDINQFDIKGQTTGDKP